MKKQLLFAILFPVVYILLLVVFVLNSGAGHNWGTGAFFAISLPLGAISIGLESVFPGYGFELLFPVLGFVQYAAIGYFVGAWVDRRQNRGG